MVHKTLGTVLQRAFKDRDGAQGTLERRCYQGYLGTEVLHNALGDGGVLEGTWGPGCYTGNLGTEVLRVERRDSAAQQICIFVLVGTAHSRPYLT